jgi:hypothetical protein
MSTQNSKDSLSASKLDAVKSAHYDCSLHRALVERSKLVGCFHCMTIFPPSEITEWIDNEETAICPYCGIDAVLPDSVDFEGGNFLKDMHVYWF